MPNEDIQNLIREEARRAGVPVELALAIAEQESGFNPAAVGPEFNFRGGKTRALGTFQLLPTTGEMLGVDPSDPHDNIRGGVKYISQLLTRHGGDQAKALKEYGGVVTNTTYVPQVLGRVQKFKQSESGMAQQQMQTFEVTDPRTGMTIELTGSRTPTEQEIKDAFAKVQPQGGQAAPRRGDPVSEFAGGVKDVVLPTDTLSDVWEGPKYVAKDLGRSLMSLFPGGESPRMPESAKLLGGALYDASAEQARQVMPAVREGKYGEAVGRALGSIPVFGPLGAAIGDEAKEGNYARAAGMATGALGPMAIGGRGAAAKGKPTTARSLQGMAQEKFVQFTAPDRGPNAPRLQNLAEKHAPAVLRDPEMGAFTREDFKFKVEDRLTAAQETLDAAHDARNAGLRYPTKAIVRMMDRRINQLGVQGDTATTTRSVSRPSLLEDPNAPKGTKLNITEQVSERVGQDITPGPNMAEVATLTKMRNEVAALGPSARYEDLRRIRMSWDKVAKVKYLKDPQADLLKQMGDPDGAFKGTGIIRDFLAKRDPVTAKANVDYSLWRGMDEVLQAAKQVNRRPKLLSGILNRWAGAIAGSAVSAGDPMTAMVGYLIGQSVESIGTSGITTKLATARRMQRLSDALRGGNLGQINAAIKDMVKASRSSGAVTGGINMGLNSQQEP